jgi:hypothetical protein
MVSPTAAPHTAPIASTSEKNMDWSAVAGGCDHSPGRPA